jgi:hypothetical protein
MTNTLMLYDQSHSYDAPCCLLQLCQCKPNTIQVLGAMKADERTQRKLSRTPSDPDIALYDNIDITPLELEQLDTLRHELLSYHDALDSIGLPDERVRRDSQKSGMSLLYGALLRALWAVLLLTLAIPGITL